VHERNDQSERVRVVGRLPSVRCGAAIALGVVVLAGCDDAARDKNAPSNGRSEAVVAASDMPSAVPTATSVSSAPTGHAVLAAPRNLCETALAQPARRFPRGAFTPIAASGGEVPAVPIPATGGRWTWINLFASWCGPCKEEIPRLRGFEQRLASKLEVAFVSLDDDERSLRQYLDGQAGSGVHGALWFEPGKPRETWLTAFDLKDPPELPVQVLLDPAGKVRCVVGGAVEDVDFARIAAIVR